MEEFHKKMLNLVSRAGSVRLLDQFGESWQHGGDLGRDRGRRRQVVTDWSETVLIGNPRQRNFLAFRADPVGGSLVGVARSGLLVVLAVAGGSVSAQLLLGLSLLARGTIRSSEAVFENINKVNN